ncbi:formyltetrahydrofolate deformylase [Rhizobium leguminosarum]|uniref:formyltetrahydrofolate deformylase n=1 Tax=Rhizobium leguminosarum TaxID=384 RepID=UPI0032B2EDA1
MPQDKNPKINTFVLTLSCLDRAGIVAAVSSDIARMGGNIIESAQHRDAEVNQFFMRIAFETAADAPTLSYGLRDTIAHYDIAHELIDASRKPRIIIMVSKFDHAMLHLLYQIRVGWLNAEVVAVVSNHEDSRRTAETEGIPYHVLKVTKENKVEKEAELYELVETTCADLVVLARYMQVLSDDLSEKLAGKVINIHHSFLPSFKGSKPYHQAFDRGVKLIGATCHYVTADLDEGPIIEQETERVTHAMTAEHYVATGRDIESRVLARGVKLHVENRVMMNGHKTVVFS